MHELGICDAMLKMVRGIAQESELKEVYSITIEVGSLSGVVPKFLEDCWTAVTDGTEFEQTRMIVEVDEGEASCLDCGKTFVADLNRPVCPFCGSSKLLPISGKDLTIKEIQGD